MTAVKAAAVVGRPIDHSLSPVIHGAWLEAAGIEGRYLALSPMDDAEFAALLDEGAAGRLVGCNVTAPYKGAALAWARRAGAGIGPEAEAAGSANLLAFHDGRVRAESTDGAGMVAAIREQAPDLEIAAGPVVVLGAGGAARAAVFALRAEGVLDVRVVNRTVGKAEDLATAAGGGVSAWSLADISEALDRSHLLINAASRLDSPDLSPMATGAVLDMTYRPLMTPLLKAAAARGLTPVDGLAMLIGQARPSFEALFGQPPPAIDVRAICLRVMEAPA